MPAKRCTDCLANAFIMAWSPFISAFINISAISSGVRPSMLPPLWPLPSPCICKSCCSRHNSSFSLPSWAMLYSGPRNEKYTSKMVSNARQWFWLFTNVAASAYLNASRSSIGISLTASIASKFSVRLTGKPALRSSTIKPDIKSRTGISSTHLSTDSSFAALAMSVWYLRRMCNVSFAS